MFLGMGQLLSNAAYETVIVGKRSKTRALELVLVIVLNCRSLADAIY